VIYFWCKIGIKAISGTCEYEKTWVYECFYPNETEDNLVGPVADRNLLKKPWN
jgi:hypothetical protein